MTDKMGVREGNYSGLVRCFCLGGGGGGHAELHGHKSQSKILQNLGDNSPPPPVQGCS